MQVLPGTVQEAEAQDLKAGFAELNVVHRGASFLKGGHRLERGRRGLLPE